MGRLLHRRRHHGRDALETRRGERRPQLRHGEYAFFDVGAGVLAFRRSHEGRNVVVVMNVSGAPRSVDGHLVSGRYSDLRGHRQGTWST